MRPHRILVPVLLALFAALPAGAGQEVMEIDPLAEKDLFHFKQEGEDAAWKIDDESDDLLTLIVHEKAASDTSLLFIKRKFKHGFRLSMEVEGGSRNKGLSFFLVPPEGDRIEVPFSPRWLARRTWHEFVVTVENGEAYVKVDDDEGDRIQVQEGVPYTFALHLDKRSEAAFRRMKLLFLVVSEEQMEPEEGFVRIFDGKTDEGWVKAPEGFEHVFKVGDQKIEGKFEQGPNHYAVLIYDDAVFVDYVLRFKASADTRGLRLIASAEERTGIDDYFARDRDWNEVEWATEKQTVTLKVNGNVVYTHKQDQGIRVKPVFSLYPGGQCTLRDIRIKGTNIQPGASWGRYVAESGGAIGIGGGRGADQPGGAFGGRGNDQGGGAHDGAGPATRTLFDGKSIADWNARPAGVWEVVDEKVVGLTLDKDTPAEIIYGKLVFTDYRLTCQVQRGTTGAKFVARAVPKQVADKPPALVDIKPEWLADQEWNDFDIDVYDGVIKVKVNGKEVFRGTVPKDQGFLGFVIGPNSAIGLKNIVWHRPM